MCPCELNAVESVCSGFSTQVMKINLLSRSLPSRVPSWCRDCGQVMDGHVPCLNNQHKTRHLIVPEHGRFAGASKESLYSMRHLTALCMTCASENYGKNEQWISGDSKKYSSFYERLFIAQAQPVGLCVLTRFRRIAKNDSLLLSVQLSVRPHGTIWFLLDGFSFNLLLEIFRKFVEKIQLPWNLTRIIGTSREDQYIFFLSYHL